VNVNSYTESFKVQVATCTTSICNVKDVDDIDRGDDYYTVCGINCNHISMQS